MSYSPERRPQFGVKSSEVKDHRLVRIAGVSHSVCSDCGGSSERTRGFDSPWMILHSEFIQRCVPGESQVCAPYASIFRPIGMTLRTRTVRSRSFEDMRPSQSHPRLVLLHVLLCVLAFNAEAPPGMWYPLLA